MGSSLTTKILRKVIHVQCGQHAVTQDDPYMRAIILHKRREIHAWIDTFSRHQAAITEKSISAEKWEKVARACVGFRTSLPGHLSRKDARHSTDV